MSIQSEITRISGNVADAFEAIEAKGVQVPAGSNSDDLADLIAMIRGGGVVVTETPDSHGGTVVEITAEEVISLQSKEATPTTSAQTITADTGYTGLAQVKVNPIPSEYIIPSGTSSITQNGTFNIAQYASVSVSVSGSAPVIESLSVTPTESSQTFTASGGTDGYSPVTVGAISNTYVGTSVPRRTSLTTNAATVTASAGYYSSAVSATISSGSAFTPATTITVFPGISVDASGLITATAASAANIVPTVNAGYITAGSPGTVTISGSRTSQLTVQAATTITPTKSVQTAVASGRYTTGIVSVAAIPAAYQDVTGVTASAAGVLSGTAFVTSSGTLTNGTLVIQHYYTGSSAPSSSLGVNGDIYLQTS